MILRTFREWDFIKFGKCNDETCIPEKYDDEVIALAQQLENEEKTNIFDLRYKAIKFKNFCGVISTENITIEILPKIGCEKIDDEKTHGLFVMLLHKTGQINFPELGQANFAPQDKRLLDVFIQDFCNKVSHALRGGMIADYVEMAENLKTIRGRLYLVEHLRQNFVNKSRLFCIYDERTIDNAYNQILKSVFGNLLQYAVDSKTRSAVMSLRHKFDNVTNKPAKASDIKKLTFNRMNSRWKNIFAKAKFFLKRQFPDIRAGKNSGPAVMYNMQDLFEKAVGEKIKSSTSMEVSLKDTKESLADGVFSVEPDIVIRNEGKVISILDAKWKSLHNDNREFDVSHADAYQINAYADVYECKNIALIFPATKEHEAGVIKSFPLNTELKPTLHIITVDLESLALDEVRLPDELIKLIGGKIS